MPQKLHDSKTRRDLNKREKQDFSPTLEEQPYRTDSQPCGANTEEKIGRLTFTLA